MHVHEPSRDLGLSAEASGPPRRPLTKLATMIAVLEAAGLGLFAVTVPDTQRGKEGNGPPGRVSAASGPFTRVWQVLGSNQRRLSRRFTARPSKPTQTPLTSAYAVRGEGPGRRRPLCVREHRFPGAVQPRTEAVTATDGGRENGYADRPHSSSPLTWYFRMPVR